jgi:hypothetical protein
MSRAIKTGLVVGLVGLVLTFCISGFSGLFSMVSPFLAGGFAGFFAAGKALSKGQGAGYGAIAGGIAGGMAVHGEMIGRMLVIFAQVSQLRSYGIASDPFGSSSEFLTLYLLSVLPAIGFGALAGAGGGFLGAKDQVPKDAPSEFVQ